MGLRCVSSYSPAGQTFDASYQRRERNTGLQLPTFGARRTLPPRYLNQEVHGPRRYSTTFQLQLEYDSFDQCAGLFQCIDSTLPFEFLINSIAQLFRFGLEYAYPILDSTHYGIDQALAR